ncbi:MAG TPA: hypothetical protein VMX35_15100 [Acidobacteriota bacterium]|nr:hypothetical protein [Acidobacteriota bacterium]
MSFFNAILNTIFDGYFGLAGMLGGDAALWIISALAGVVLLLIFKITSNQKAIKRTKERISASFLEVRLFKDDMSQMMSAQGRIFGSAFRYMGHAMAPMLWMIVPVLLLLIQMNLWYGYEPLDEGDSALVVARIEGSEPLVDMPLRLETDEGLTVDTPPLRIEALREVNWRVRAETPGSHTIRLVWGDGKDEAVTQTVQVDGAFIKIEPIRARGAWEELWNPGAVPLPSPGPVSFLEVTYSEAEVNLFGFRMHWVIAFFILSLVFGFAFKGVFGVEI